PVLLQTLNILRDVDLGRMGHNSVEYVHTVTEALKLALADRDTFYGDPDFAKVPARGLLADGYAAERRAQIDPSRADPFVRRGDPWRFDGRTARSGVSVGRRDADAQAARDPVPFTSPDTTCINVADAKGNLFSAAPSSAWFFGGVFIAGDTGVPLG